MRGGLRVLVVLVGVALAAVAVGSAAGAGFTAGSDGVGDPFFPQAGNGGYDVSNYSLKLGYDPSTRVLTGSAVITATATQNLSRFDLDLRGFTLSHVAVNGAVAEGGAGCAATSGG